MNIDSWQIGPMLRALVRNKVVAAIIAIQVAINMAIIVNAFSMIVDLQANLQRQSGVDEENSFYLTSTGHIPNYDERAAIQTDLAAIRQIFGVVGAIHTNDVPLSGRGWSIGLKTETGNQQNIVGTAIYMVDDHGLNALDLELLAGEYFSPAQIRWRVPGTADWPSQVLVTKALAIQLFPDSNWLDAVGKSVYSVADQPLTIVGIVDKLQAAWVTWDGVEHSMLTPEYNLSGSNIYYVRTKEGHRDEIMETVVTLLESNNKGRIVHQVTTMEETRDTAYKRDQTMQDILILIVGTLAVVNALGIIGLANFSVNRRKIQIGVRRALGAGPCDIVRYFMLESLLVSGAGLMLGVFLTIGLNMVLVDLFSLQPLHMFLLPLGVIVLLIICQLAVFLPAKRASLIPPAVVTQA